MEPSEVICNIGSYKYFWDNRVTIEIDRIRESRTGVYGEITCRYDGVLLDKLNLSLLSTRSRADPITSAARRTKESLHKDDWRDMVDYACIYTVHAHRTGNPPIKVGCSPILEQKHLLFPFLSEGQANTIYAPGDSAKSLLAIFIGLIMQSGEPLLGFVPTKQCNTLYLDYETSKDEINSRIKKIKTGMNIRDDVELTYRFCSRPLSSDIDQIEQVCNDNNIEFIIVDSCGMAISGDSKEAETVIAYFQSLRYLQKTTLSIDHVSKEAASKGPYGSVYKYNEARNLFAIDSDSDEESDARDMIITHTKCNNGRRVIPIGFRFSFIDDDAITVHKIDPKQSLLLSDKLPIQDRIAKVLQNGAKTIIDISEESGIEYASVKACLGRLKGRRFFKLQDKKWGILDKGTDSTT